MPRLSFTVTDALASAPAAQPTVTLALRVDDVDNEPIASIALRAQVRIDPTRRRVNDEEADALVGVFGVRERWSDTVRPFLWTHSSTTVGPFTGSTTTALPIVSSADFDAQATRYTQALQTGTIPLLLLFSGTTIVQTSTGLRFDPVPWTAETRFDLPVTTWRAALEGYAPGAQAVLLSRELIARLEKHRIATEAPTLAAALDRLVPP